MRLWIFSDLHVDANHAAPLKLPDPHPEHDIVIMAGDLCEGVDKGVAWIEAQGLNRRPVVYVPGNHEFFGTSLVDGLLAGREAARRLGSVHVLDCETIEIDGVPFHGATFWTDFRLFGDGLERRSMVVADQVMLDHRRIRQGAEGLFSPLDAARQHKVGRAFLEAEAERRAGKLGVVVTHTAPSLQSIAEVYRDNLMTAAFATRSEDLVPKARVWVHGHTHIGCDYVLSGCRVINNPRGYVTKGEGGAFNPGLVIDVDV